LIVLARHAGPGDSFTLVRLLLSTVHRRPRVIVKAALQWDPGLDVVLNRLNSCFIPSGTGARDEDRTATIGDYARCLHSQDALLLFPEGANWTPRRHHHAVAGLLRAGRPRAAHRAQQQPRVLPPRPAGTIACLDARPDADVLLAAHTGLDSLTSARAVWQALPFSDRPVRMRLRWYPAADVPRDPDAAREWLETQWSAMHAWIAARDATSNDAAVGAPTAQ
jgi:1-acyl-sn-glycerol-3-phosphate acyltransferase